MLNLSLSYSRSILSGYCLLKHITKPMPRRTINSVCRLCLSMTVDRCEAHSSLDNQPVWPPRDFSALNIRHPYTMSTQEKRETKFTVLKARGHDSAGLSNEKVDNILLLRYDLYQSELDRRQEEKEQHQRSASTVALMLILNLSRPGLWKRK